MVLAVPKLQELIFGLIHLISALKETGIGRN